METNVELLKRIANLEHKLDVLVENRVGMLEDIEAINRLQHMYGYYIDLCLWDAMTDLFADEGAAIEIGRRGRYIGKENVRKFLRDVNGGGIEGLRHRQVINHTQHQGVVTVSSDRNRAQGRWRAIIQAGGGAQRQPIPQLSQAQPGTPSATPAGPPGALTNGAMMYAEGVYENTYVRENGVWKIGVLFWVPTYYVSHAFESMWFESAAASTAQPPQRAPTPPVAGLGRQFLPFHYLHPITGRTITEIVAADDA